MKKLVNKDDKFYIAGHNGMVGSSIIKNLLDKGYCNNDKKELLLTASRRELDLTNNNNVYKWFKKNKPDIVIIAAAKVGGIKANYKYPYNFISENLKIQQNLIEAAWIHGTRRLLFLGSSCIYPKNSNLPIKEEELLGSYLEKTNESYAIAKIAGLKLCEALRKQYGFDAISLMPTNLYGPGDNYDLENSHVLAALIKKFIIAKKENAPSVNCWGNGSPLREFLHVNDLAEACIHVLEKWDPDKKESPKDKNGNNLYYLNVGSGEELSIKELAQYIADLTNYKGKIVWDEKMPNGTHRKNLDISRIKEMGWSPKISLESGIKKVIADIEYKLNNLKEYKKYLKNF